MHAIETLSQMSVVDLREELRARELGDVTALHYISDRLLLQTLRQYQFALYGMDDRKDLFELTSEVDRADAESVVAVFASSAVVDNHDGTSTLQTQSLLVAKNVCPQERFHSQPCGAKATGVLVAPTLIATAGHVATKSNVTELSFVFGYRMLDASTPQTVIDNSDIYRGQQIYQNRVTATKEDWALVRLDRAAQGRRVAPIRRTGKIADHQSVHVIGHPLGLPAKFAAGAAVRDNAPESFFVANLDTYGGNSGSPVFNSSTHEVEGILVRGEVDLVKVGQCRVSLPCPDTGCRGEDCNRTTEFSSFL